MTANRCERQEPLRGWQPKNATYLEFVLTAESCSHKCE